LILRSRVLDGSLQKEFPPSAAEIKRSHTVYQEPVVLAADRPNERPPGVAQPFNRSDAAFFHIRSNAWSQLAGLGVLRITAAFENGNKRGLQSPGNLAGTLCPIIEPA